MSNLLSRSQWSEDDIRTQVVYRWLRDIGFEPDQIFLEFSFKIQVGHAVLRVGTERPVKDGYLRPRTDVLVRSTDGKNIMIVEIKSPNESLDDTTKAQGFSYAWGLRIHEGGIPPFVVLCNGNQTKIYDSLTEESIEGECIPLDHRYVKAGFRVNLDNDDLRVETLEKFVSLSPDNLIIFCRNQVEYRMSLLKGDDPSSDKKYIPILYIERQKAREKFQKLLKDDQKQAILITGAPQVGKTNFMCRSVELLLEQEIACLFYPAISLPDTF
ncbi:MAG: type I restriction enzyme HsdR N-terminal domain-containing protein [Candidatus Babeliaceae bacterium]|nr:type I restriction enzyme HsdR N-terminal domain-containing protein [Candidatus Babeliaceae bacterium]